jgi:Na+/phosphate symporter
MFEGNLADLDELVQSVRNRNSREYIGEAVANYRARCFRSAISATWVATSYDIISKIRELSIQGDAQARAFITDVDKAISLRVVNPSESKKQLQAIEGRLLNVAHEEFELLTDHDLKNMRRLIEDRHLCAHPAFAGEDNLFQPSPDLVRMHICPCSNQLIATSANPRQGGTSAAQE